MKKIILSLLIVSPCFAVTIEPFHGKGKKMNFQEQHVEQGMIDQPQNRLIPQQRIVGLMVMNVALDHNPADMKGKKAHYPKHTNRDTVPTRQKFPKPKNYRLQQSRRGH